MSKKVRIKNNIIYGPELQSLPPFDSLGKFIFDQCEKYSDRICQVCAETGNEETYASVRSRAIRVALQMRQLGAQRGDVINICALNSLETQIPVFAALFLGATICSIDPSMSVSDTEHLLGLVHAKFIFVCNDGAKLISQVKLAMPDGFTCRIVNLDSSDFEQFQLSKDTEAEKTFQPVEVDPRIETAFIVFSSGTTGLPKGIKLSHYGLQFGIYGDLYYSRFYRCICAHFIIDFREKGLNFESILHSSSLYWISAVMLTVAKFVVGGKTIMCRHFRKEKILKIFQDFKVTCAFLSSNFAFDITNTENIEDYDLSKLHCMIFAGACLPAVQMKKVQKLLPTTHSISGYGMTELAAFATMFDLNGEDDLLINERAKSAGKPMMGVQIKVVDEDGNSLGPNTEGQVLILTPSIMIEYHNVDSSSEFDENGYIKTGDIGYYDEDGCLYIIDRIKEMFKYNGWHIVPASIEAILRDHPAIAECVLYGTPDEKSGELPTAAVVLKTGCTTNKKDIEKSIVKFIEDRVLDRQRLRGGVKFIDEIPRTPSGKVVRRKVRDMFRN